MAKVSKAKKRAALAPKASRAQLAVREVEASEFRSLEGFAYRLTVEDPDLMYATPDAIAAQVGLSSDTVSFLLHQSREFAVLLDWHAVGSSWGWAQRMGVYGDMVRKMRDPDAKLGDVVRAAEYFDKKAGIAPADHAGKQGTVIQVAVVQEGEGGYERTHTPLKFGGQPTNRAGSGEGRGRLLAAAEVIDVEPSGGGAS